jgi:hypothetical protein
VVCARRQLPQRTLQPGGDIADGESEDPRSSAHIATWTKGFRATVGSDDDSIQQFRNKTVVVSLIEGGRLFPNQRRNFSD